MNRVILAPADLGSAALDTLKDWLAIRSDSEDSTLETLLRASLDMCESFTGIMPLETTCEEILPAHCGWRALATKPVHAITDVVAIPVEGPHIPLVPDAYEIELAADGAGLVRIVRQGAAGRIAVHFIAGLAPDWSALPEALRHGIIRLAAHYHRERDTGTASNPPAAVTALWHPWRRLRVA